MSPEIIERVRDGVVYLIALILSICVHEFGHAFVADKLGDPLPRSQGRVTLNPIAHIDPIGTLLMPAIGAAFPGLPVLGWGRPVQVSLSARHLTRRFSTKISHLIIAAAGPMMNVLFGLLLSGVYAAMLASGGAHELQHYVARVVIMNFCLAFFNLIPCPPLDGGAILHGILPRNLEFISEWLNRYGFIILIAALARGLIDYVIIPAVIAAQWWLMHVQGWVA
jgi:Zn-dependent protease